MVTPKAFVRYCRGLSSQMGGPYSTDLWAPNQSLPSIPIGVWSDEGSIFMAGMSDSSSAFEERPLMQLPWGDVLSRCAFSFYALRVQDVIFPRGSLRQSEDPGATGGRPVRPRSPSSRPLWAFLEGASVLTLVLGGYLSFGSRVGMVCALKQRHYGRVDSSPSLLAP